MTKRIYILLLVALCATSAFAIDISVGGNEDYTLAWTTSKIKLAGNSTKPTRTKNHLLGFNAFFDAQYARVSLGASFTVRNDSLRATQLNLSLLGKYPVDLYIASIYPLLGFDLSFNVANSVKLLDKWEPMNDNKELHRYYFVGGVGADIPITKRLYLTPTALLGINMKKNTLNSDVKNVKDYMFNIGIGVGYKLLYEYKNSSF